jgi:hypothetical protein
MTLARTFCEFSIRKNCKNALASLKILDFCEIENFPAFFSQPEKRKFSQFCGRAQNSRILAFFAPSELNNAYLCG